VALSWPNLPCDLKAAIGIGKQTLAILAAPTAAADARESGLRQPPAYGPVLLSITPLDLGLERADLDCPLIRERDPASSLTYRRRRSRLNLRAFLASFLVACAGRPSPGALFISGSPTAARPTS
jgi:hypothetical protein